MTCAPENLHLQGDEDVVVIEECVAAATRPQSMGFHQNPNGIPVTVWPLTGGSQALDFSVENQFANHSEPCCGCLFLWSVCRRLVGYGWKIQPTVYDITCVLEGDDNGAGEPTSSACSVCCTRGHPGYDPSGHDTLSLTRLAAVRLTARSDWRVQKAEQCCWKFMSQDR